MSKSGGTVKIITKSFSILENWNPGQRMGKSKIRTIMPQAGKIYHIGMMIGDQTHIIAKAI